MKTPEPAPELRRFPVKPNPRAEAAEPEPEPRKSVTAPVSGRHSTRFKKPRDEG